MRGCCHYSHSSEATWPGPWEAGLVAQSSGEWKGRGEKWAACSPPSPSRPQDGALGGPRRRAVPHTGKPRRKAGERFCCATFCPAHCTPLIPKSTSITPRYSTLPVILMMGGAGVLASLEDKSRRALELGLGSQQGRPSRSSPRGQGGPLSGAGGTQISCPSVFGPSHSKHTCSLSSIPLSLACHPHSPSAPFTPYSLSIHPPVTLASLSFPGIS